MANTLTEIAKTLQRFSTAPLLPPSGKNKNKNKNKGKDKDNGNFNEQAMGNSNRRSHKKKDGQSNEKSKGKLKEKPLLRLRRFAPGQNPISQVDDTTPEGAIKKSQLTMLFDKQADGATKNQMALVVYDNTKNAETKAVVARQHRKKSPLMKRLVSGEARAGNMTTHMRAYIHFLQEKRKEHQGYPIDWNVLQKRIGEEWRQLTWNEKEAYYKRYST